MLDHSYIVQDRRIHVPFGSVSTRGRMCILCDWARNVMALDMGTGMEVGLGKLEWPGKVTRRCLRRLVRE